MAKNKIGKKQARILDRILEMPQEVSTKDTKLTVIGFKKMLIENYKVILEYQDFYIIINT